MNIPAFCEAISRDYYAWATLCPYPKEPKRYIEILADIQAMTTPSTMHLLNLAVRHLEEGECYLEVGTWRGGTFAGAMVGNTAPGYAIDSNAANMDKHNKDGRGAREAWEENITRLGLAPRSTYIEAATPEVWDRPNLTGGHPIGVFFFDGAKETSDEAYGGIHGALPLLADNALIVVDDLNEVQIRQVLWHLRLKNSARMFPLFELNAPANCWPGWWNGLGVYVWTRQVVEEVK